MLLVKELCALWVTGWLLGYTQALLESGDLIAQLGGLLVVLGLDDLLHLLFQLSDLLASGLTSKKILGYLAMMNRVGVQVFKYGGKHGMEVLVAVRAAQAPHFFELRAIGAKTAMWTGRFGGGVFGEKRGLIE